LSSSSGVSNVYGCGGCGDRGCGRGGLGGGGWEDPLPHHLGLHCHREITLQMDDPTRVGNVVM
jgi:hypothetical protein